MILALNTSRLLLVLAGMLALSAAACTNSDSIDTSPTGIIPPNASTGPGNAFAPGEGVPENAAGAGFPSNGGGNGANAPGH